MKLSCLTGVATQTFHKVGKLQLFQQKNSFNRYSSFDLFFLVQCHINCTTDANSHAKRGQTVTTEQHVCQRIPRIPVSNSTSTNCRHLRADKTLTGAKKHFSFTVDRAPWLLAPEKPAWTPLRGPGYNHAAQCYYCLANQLGQCC